MSGEKRLNRVLRTKDEARYSYDRMSGWYDLISRSERKYKEKGLEILDVKEGETVLEIGFGTGHCIKTLALSVGSNGKVYGVDLSQGMFNITKSRINEAGLSTRVELSRGDAVQLSYNGDFFDALFMSFTLELFDTPEIPLILEECYRVLRTGGRIGITALSKKGKDSLAVRIYEWVQRRLTTYVDCRPIYVREALEDAGFLIERIHEESMFGLPVDIILGWK